MKKVLICDDERDIRDVLEMLIEVEFDAEIVHAVNGEEGIAALETEQHFDLIICDMNMPKKKGSEVFTHNKNGKNFPFFLLSADGDVDIKGMDGFLECNPENTHINKPWHEDELFEKLRPILEKAG